MKNLNFKILHLLLLYVLIFFNSMSYKSFKHTIIPNNYETILIDYKYIDNYVKHFNINCSANIFINNLTFTGKVIDDIGNNFYKIRINNIFMEVISKYLHDNELFFNWFQNCLLHNKHTYDIIINNESKINDFNLFYVFHVKRYINDTLYCYTI